MKWRKKNNQKSWKLQDTKIYVTVATEGSLAEAPH